MQAREGRPLTTDIHIHDVETLILYARRQVIAAEVIAESTVAECEKLQIHDPIIHKFTGRPGEIYRRYRSIGVERSKCYFRKLRTDWRLSN